MRAPLRRTAGRCGMRRSERFVLPKQRLEYLPESAAAAKNARLHGANAAFENFGDFVVTQSFESAQNHRGTKHAGNFLQSVLHGNLNFSRSELLKRCCTKIFNFYARVAFFGLGVDRNILLQMALEPSLVIQRFANSDAVEPGFQRAPLAELANAAEGFQENFLRTVGGVGSFAEHA